jgi:hypothetical protein
LVEQANGTVKTHLQAWKEDIGSTEWAVALPDIVLKMNRAIHGEIGRSPYEVMVDRKPRWNQHLAPHEKVEATLDYIPEESTNEQSLLDFDVDDQHNFTTSYTFDSDEDEQTSDSAVNIPNTSNNTDKSQVQNQPSTAHETSLAPTTSTLSPPLSSAALSIELTQIEQDVQIKMTKSRQKMIQKHSTRVTVERFQTGDFVTLNIPREDRVSTDNLRIFCRVIKETHHNRYQLQCKHGILSTQYPIKELLRIPDNACDAAQQELQSAPTAKVTLEWSTIFH